MIAKKSDDDVSAFNSEVDDDDDNEADGESEFSPMLTNASAYNSEGDNNDADDDVDAESERSQPMQTKLSLKEENEVLKAAMSSLKKEVTRLRQRESLSRIQARKQLPTSLRQIAASNSRRRQRPGLRPQRKFSGTALNDYASDDIGPEPDLEMHESGRGLFHRKRQHSPLERDSFLKPLQPKQKRRSFFPNDESSREMEDEESSVFLLADSTRMTDSEREEEDDDVVLPESFWAMVQDRAGWLVGLLILQSMSSFILARNERLLQEHVIIVRFLTMLVGAGGNAGNQASVRGTCESVCRTNESSVLSI
jgi:hypothetical protein